MREDDITTVSFRSVRGVLFRASRSLDFVRTARAFEGFGDLELHGPWPTDFSSSFAQVTHGGSRKFLNDGELILFQLPGERRMFPFFQSFNLSSIDIALEAARMRAPSGSDADRVTALRLLLSAVIIDKFKERSARHARS